MQDNRKREPITYNKRVELNLGFVELWEKIKHKKRYAIEFSTDELISKSVEKIKAMADIKPISLTIDSTQAKLTELTRGTLLAILKQCERLGEFKQNPQAFMTEVSRQIHKAMDELLVEGIRYQKIGGEEFYRMELFDQPELEADKKVYLIRETKTTHDSDKRRIEENLKILCGKAHFDALDNVDYRVATSVAEVVACDE